MRYTILSDTGVSFFYVKSYSRRIQVKLISYFSVYRCHGNIDFPKKNIISNFNPIPISGVNFTSIRVRKSFLNGQMKMVGLVQKICRETP